MADTPTRSLLRMAVSKRLEEEESPSILKDLANIITTNFKSLEARLLYVDSEPKKSPAPTPSCSSRLPFLEVSRKMKSYEESVGPFDRIKVVFEGTLQFKIYVYSDLLEKGTITSPDDAPSLIALKKMDDSNVFVCNGIDNYSSYRPSVGNDPRTVVHISLLNNFVRHIDCSRLCELQNDRPQSPVCSSCLSLKGYLARQKRKRKSAESSDSVHTSHQQAFSRFPFDYLSPCSKRVRYNNLRIENKKLRIQGGRFQQRLKDFDMKLNDEQSKEMTEVFQAISSSDEAVSELEKIFIEAGDKDEMLRRAWEKDMSDFYEDQDKNGTKLAFMCMVVYL